MDPSCFQSEKVIVQSIVQIQSDVLYHFQMILTEHGRKLIILDKIVHGQDQIR